MTKTNGLSAQGRLFIPVGLLLNPDNPSLTVTPTNSFKQFF